MASISDKHSEPHELSDSNKTKNEAFEESFCDIDNQLRVKIVHQDLEKKEEGKFLSLEGVRGSRFCNEIYCKILSYLDPSNFKNASQVCQVWKEIIHDLSWKSVSKAVMLKESVIGRNYRTQGWIEERHSWDSKCHCIDMVTSLVTSADMEMLGLIKSSWSTLGNVFIPKLPEVECAARLAAAGLLTSLAWMNLSNIDVSKVEKMSHLASIVETVVGLDNVTGLSVVFENLKCERLIMQNLCLGKSETRSLASSLSGSLKRVSIDANVSLHFPSLRQYDGRGSCSEIIFTGSDQLRKYDTDAEAWCLTSNWVAEPKFRSSESSLEFGAGRKKRVFRRPAQESLANNDNDPHLQIQALQVQIIALHQQIHNLPQNN